MKDNQNTLGDIKIDKISGNIYRAFLNGESFCASSKEGAELGLCKLIRRNLIKSETRKKIISNKTKEHGNRKCCGENYF